MNKIDRSVTDIDKIIEMIDKCTVLRLGLCDDGEVYIVPMNFGYTFKEGVITFYMHGATQGRKYDVIRKNPKASFEMDCDVTPYEGDVPCQYGTAFSCVMGTGVITMIDDVDKKMEAMTILMKTQTGKDFEFNEKLVSIINVFELKVEAFTAKRRNLPAIFTQGE